MIQLTKHIITTKKYIIDENKSQILCYDKTFFISESYYPINQYSNNKNHGTLQSHCAKIISTY